VSVCGLQTRQTFSCRQLKRRERPRAGGGVEECGTSYGLAASYSGDVDSDRKDVSDGVYAWLAGGDAARNNPTNRGTLAAWAWGFERCADYYHREGKHSMTSDDWRVFMDFADNQLK
jgi:hypothetical protein